MKSMNGIILCVEDIRWRKCLELESPRSSQRPRRFDSVHFGRRGAVAAAPVTTSVSIL